MSDSLGTYGFDYEGISVLVELHRWQSSDTVHIQVDWAIRRDGETERGQILTPANEWTLLSLSLTEKNPLDIARDANETVADAIQDRFGTDFDQDTFMAKANSAAEDSLAASAGSA